jgi:lipopolysaccharide/colanic/teichoic acid biosynthesis glycosyltransferase
LVGQDRILVGAWRGKRLFDLAGATVALHVAALPMAGIATAIRMTMGGPVLFKQRRAGLHGEAFDVYKFRTMTDARDSEGALLPDEQRLTELGKFLRRSSLDELPQIFNVLEGNMSLVGPRPFFLRYVDRYTPEQARRHDVKPGITGWNQVNGRSGISWDEKLALDLEYVDNQSVVFDLKILCRTVWIVVSRKGLVGAAGEAEPEFMGTAASDPDPDPEE